MEVGRLDVGGDPCTQGAIAIANALRVNTSVESAYLVTNKVGDEGAEAFMAMFPHNSSLRELHLQDNLLAPKTKTTMIAEAKKRGGLVVAL